MRVSGQQCDCEECAPSSESVDELLSGSSRRPPLAAAAAPGLLLESLSLSMSFEALALTLGDEAVERSELLDEALADERRPSRCAELELEFEFELDADPEAPTVPFEFTVAVHSRAHNNKQDSNRFESIIQNRFVLNCNVHSTLLVG